MKAWYSHNGYVVGFNFYTLNHVLCPFCCIEKLICFFEHLMLE